MVTYIIGVGLIGGSMALALRERAISSLILGSDSSSENEKIALEMGLVDRIVTFDEGIEQADVIILAIPVSVAPMLAVRVLNRIKPGQTLMDVGSIKGEICEMVAMHVNRGRFVATHPMWGTEYSGPRAAQSGAFISKTVVLCDSELSEEDALQSVKTIYNKLDMNIIEMNSEEHDLHAAYISHISHITSFALAITVLEKEREEQHIFDMAATGFESTVRLAKSSYSTWIPVLLRNKYNVLDVLREHIHQLQLMRKAIEQNDEEQLKEMITRANTIQRIIDK
ncbi:MAG: prephenate dehydrogenase [Rikenellaceae bacterium]